MDEVRVELARILIRETDDQHVVELREVEGEERTFPIMIGLAEAAAIERRLMGQAPPRPQTHELVASIIDELGWRVQRVVINDLRGGTFFARLHLERPDTDDHAEIDSRPSDAIAIGVATDVPIFVAPHVLDEVARPTES